LFQPTVVYFNRSSTLCLTLVRRHAPLLTAALLLAVAPPVAAQPVQITDMEGRELRLARPAERVASIPIPMASTLIALDGSTRRLVGMHPLALSAIQEGILGRIFPEAARIPANITAPNFVPNIEALAATRPDLVIQWGGRGADIVRPIENAGLTVMLILYGTEERAPLHARRGHRHRSPRADRGTGRLARGGAAADRGCDLQHP
jgi:iron complex transport system substrate-binding protein